MLQLYDKNHNKIKGLINYKDLKIESDLTNGDGILSFLISLKDSTGIEHEGYIRTKTQEYVIKEAPLKDKWNEVVADLNLEELKGNPIRNFDSTEQTIDKCIKLAIAGSGYNVEIKDNITKRRTVRATDTNSLELLTDIKETYLVEIKFDTINKKVYVYEKIGSDKGAYFMDSLNLRKLEVTGDSYEFYTKMIAIGATNQETGETLKVEVVNNTYSSKVTAVIWKDERYTNEESLRADAQYKLDEIAKPKKSYAASVYDLANMNEKYKNILDYKLGDTVTVIDKEKGIKLKLRIVKITEYPLSPEENKVELANAVFTFDQLVKSQKKYESTVDNITSDNGTVSPDAIKSSVLSLINVNVQNLSAVSARIGELFVNELKVDVANIKTGIVGKLLAQKIETKDLVASNVKFDIAEGGSLSLKDLLTQFLSANSTETLHLTARNVVIDEAVIKDLIASKIKVSDLMAGNIDSERFNIVSKNGNLIIKDNTIQIKDSNRVRIQIGKDASGDYTLNAWDKNGKLLFNSNGITADAIKAKIIRDDMVADNANIDGSKVNIESLIECVNNNNTKTLNASKIVMDGTSQTMNVAFKQLTTTIDNLDATNKNLVTYNTDNWEQGVISASNGTENLTDRYLRLNSSNYIPVEVGKYTLTKYSSDFYLYCIYYDENKKFKSGFGLINDMNYTLNLSYKGFVRVEIKKANSAIITLAELKNYKFKFEKGGESTEFSYNPLDIGSLSQTLQTEFNVQQGQINQLIKDTTITTSSGTKTLKDAYNETKSTVDGTVQTVANMQTTVNSINATNLIKAGGGDYLSVDSSIWGKINFTTTDMFTLDGATNNKWYRLFNTSSSTASNSGLIYVTNTTAIKASSNKKISISFRYYCNDSNGKVDGIKHIRMYILQEHNNSNNFYNSYKYVDLDKTTSAKLYKQTFTLNASCTRFMIRFDSANNAIASGVTTAFRFKDIMVVNGSIPANEWSPSFEDLQIDINSIETRTSKVEQKTTDEAFTIQVQKNQNRVFNIRYIRDYMNGSNTSTTNVWTDVQALLNNGGNACYNKTVTGSCTINNPENIVDWNTSTYATSSNTGLQYITIDLGQIYNNVDEIKVFHATDGRICNSTKTEVSADGTNWVTLFDSAVSGTYVETIYGHSIKVNGTSFNSSQVTINELGLHVKNGAIDIQNNAGDTVFGADSAGNLDLVGNITTKSNVTNKKALELNYTNIFFYDWANTTDRTDIIGNIFTSHPKSGATDIPGLEFAHGKNCYSAISYLNPDDNTYYPYIIFDREYWRGGIKPIEFYQDVNVRSSMYWGGQGAYVNGYNGNQLRVWLTTLGDTDWNAKFSVAKKDENKDIFRVMPYTSGNDKILCNGNTYVQGDFYVSGNKHRIVKTDNHGIVGQNAYETCSPYFGDILEVTIPDDGVVYIPFDPIFLETVNTKYKYQVSILSVYGNENMIDDELKKLWCRCIKREELYFVLKGSPGAVVGVEVKCKQKGCETNRLERIYVNTDNTTIDTSTIDEELEKEKTKEQVINNDSVNDYNKYIEDLEKEMLNYDTK